MARNSLGPIASTYRELQGLQHLELAYPFAGAITDNDRLTRSVFQAVEILAINLTDLASRIVRSLEADDLSRALTQARWRHSMNRLILQISSSALRLVERKHHAARFSVSLVESRALDEYAHSLPVLDRSMLAFVERTGNTLSSALNNTGDPLIATLLYLLQITSHETCLWQRELARLTLDAHCVSFDDWITGPSLRNAIFDTQLTGDTFYMQFRCLHQVPELLGHHVVRLLDQSTAAITDNQFAVGERSLQPALILFSHIIGCLQPLVDCLTMVDYHEIRENLGHTSGSHSVTLREKLLTATFESLCLALLPHLNGNGRSDSVADSTQPIATANIIAADVATLCFQIWRWRNMHLQLARNNLGLGMTRSLVGAANAVRAVEFLSQQAAMSTPIALLLRHFNIWTDDVSSAIVDYIQSNSSLYCQHCNVVGDITRARFPQVQDRTGYFH